MLNLEPQVLNLPSVTTGDTYPATQFLEVLADTTLARVRMKVKHETTGELALSLDSDVSGITIAETAPGEWDYSIDQINEITMAPGFYVFDIEVIDTNGTKFTEFSGKWEILTEVTDV